MVSLESNKIHFKALTIIAFNQLNYLNILLQMKSPLNEIYAHTYIQAYIHTPTRTLILSLHWLRQTHTQTHTIVNGEPTNNSAVLNGWYTCTMFLNIKLNFLSFFYCYHFLQLILNIYYIRCTMWKNPWMKKLSVQILCASDIIFKNRA